MQAVQVHTYGSPDVLIYETVAKPAPQAGEVLIRVESASVNYSDVARRSNALYPFPTPLPFIPGNEVAGTVEAVGSDVTGFTSGMAVFALVGNGSNGYAQYAVTPATQVIPVPPGVTHDQAAALPVAGTTAMLTIRDIARLQPGETILIQGAAGGVGSYAVQLAKLMGASVVIGATSSPNKFQAVLDQGATHVIDYTHTDWSQQVLEITNGRGVDVVLEMSGGDVFSQSIACLAPFGRIVVYGVASGETIRLDEATILHFFHNPALNQTIHVFNLGLWFGMRPQEAGAALSDLIGYVASGQVKVNVNHVFPLSQAATAHRMIESRLTTGKVILKPWADPVIA